jgi:CDP-diacylglycerol---serine O-phosphatidyltransferase
MKKIIAHIPNSITCVNLFCGCIAIPNALERNWETVMILTFVALIADFLDGFVARLLKVSSKIGGELDSLADVVTFGLLPGFVMYQLMSDISCNGGCSGLFSSSFYPYIAFLIPILSAVRLAKFNVDDSQTDHFKGLPTPANAVFMISMPFIMIHFGLSPRFIMVLVIFFSLLLVSDIRLIALKFKSFKIQDNLEKIALVVASIILLFIFKWMAFAYIIPVYLLISVAYFTLQHKKSKQ